MWGGRLDEEGGEEEERRKIVLQNCKINTPNKNKEKTAGEGNLV